jgi:NTE family protein
MAITPEHVVACTGYPFYGISWSKIDGRYLWDGSLLSNTPLIDVLDASSKREKRVYISELFPRKQEKLPNNMSETWHRARDIMFIDKSTHKVIQHSETLKKYTATMEEMYDIISNSRLDEKEKTRFKKVEQEYNNLVHLRGALIDQIISIKRKERSGGHYLLDADFSLASIKELIRQGEEDAEDAISNNNHEILKKS